MILMSISSRTTATGQTMQKNILLKYLQTRRNSQICPSCEKGEPLMVFTNETIPLRLKEQFRRNLKSIVAVGKTHNIMVVLMTEPFLADQKKFEIGF